MRMTSRDWALLLLLSFLWGGSFFFAAVAMRDIPPLTLVALRTGLASLALAVLVRTMADGWPFGIAPRAFVVMGLLNNLLPFSLLFWAQTVIPSGLVSILNATTPIFSILVAHAVLPDERITAKKTVGVAFGFAGVVVLLGGNLQAGAGGAIWGMVACLGAALSYGISGAYGRRFKGMGLSPQQVALGQLSATTVMAIPLAALVEAPWTLPAPQLATVGAVLALALASTALAYVIFFRLLASAGAVNAALVTLLVPVTAILLGTMILGEALSWRHFLGMALITLGLVAIDGRLFDRMRGC